ncbi:MAG: hypothetical protein EOP48_26340 [Sphingobacteriales bacterium]|nr:MAG: hypothetical protein EOP48_26340 [Sphingobacteriales bacterium]
MLPNGQGKYALWEKDAESLVRAQGNHFNVVEDFSQFDLNDMLVRRIISSTDVTRLLLGSHTGAVPAFTAVHRIAFQTCTAGVDTTVLLS